MQFVLILLTIAGGMGLSVEAGILGPLGGEVGDLWATFSIFGIGTILTFLLMLFFSPRSAVVLRAARLDAAWWRARPHLCGGVNRRRTYYRRGDDHDWRPCRTGFQKPVD